MNNFFSWEGNMRFERFDLVHMSPILLILLLIVFIYQQRKGIRAWRYESRFTTIFGYFLLLVETSVYVWRYFHGHLTINNLPMELCSFTIPLTGILLITKNRKLFDIIFVWQVLGGLAAMLQPTINKSYDHFHYYQFMIGHGMIVVSAFYMIFIHKFYPDTKALKKSYGFLFVIGVLIGIFNYNFGTTYLGLAPGGYGKNTIVDNMAPYPYNVLGMLFLTLIAYFMVYFVIRFTKRISNFETEDLSPGNR